MAGLSLRQKETLDLAIRVKELRNIIKRWFYYAGIKFLQDRELTDTQEEFLEEVTNFFLNNLENIEKDKDFLKKIELGPIKLPSKKVAK